jgi:hypothetical protein
MPKQTFNFRKGDDRIMSPRQFCTKIMDCNLYDFLAFLVWYLKRDMTCIQCIETRNMTSGLPPDCITCGLPTARLMKRYFGRKEL